MKRKIMIVATFVVGMLSVKAQQVENENKPLENQSTENQKELSASSEYSIGYHFSTSYARGLQLGYHFKNRNHLSLFASPFALFGESVSTAGLQYRYDVFASNRWALGAYIGSDFVYSPSNYSFNPYTKLGATLNYGFTGSYKLNKHFYLNGSIGHEFFFGKTFSSKGVESFNLMVEPSASIGINYRFKKK